MELEPRQQRQLIRVSYTERETAVEVLQRAAAEGRLPLEDFSDRVGLALAADTAEQLERATAGIDMTPELPCAGTVSSVLAVLGDRRQVGRWRLPRSLRAYGLFGDVHLDLRDVVVGDEVVEINAVTFFGNLCVDVPEGVEVELGGFDVLGDRELRLARVPRRPGTPLIRIRAHGVLGDVDVRTPMPGEEPPSWWEWFKGSRRRRRGGLSRQAD
jgi:hypothetical protein